MALASLIIALITLIFALLIHSETRQILSRINAMLDTLPGAHDVHRLIRDIEETNQRRGKIICDAEKNTHIAYSCPFSEIPVWTKIRNRFWSFIYKLACIVSGDIYGSMVETSKPRQSTETKS